MRLIAFSHSKFIPSEAEMLSRILPWVDDLHIRKDAEFTLDDWKQLLSNLSPEFRQKIWLHDHYELAVDHKLAGIHLSRKAMAQNKGLGVYAALHALKTSVSCHDLKNAQHLAELYEQVFLCPVFDSISKPDHSAGFDLKLVKDFLAEEHDATINALGGIRLENIDELSNLGFDGLAVLGALWNSDDPEAYIKQAHLKCRQQVNIY